MLYNSEPLEVILKKTESAHTMMKLWKTSYLETRASIEMSGKGARWEFDQNRLFKDTDYLAVVRIIKSRILK
jgi:dynein heavy chain